MTVTLFEAPPTRSARVRWTLLELDAPFESVSGPHLFGSDQVKAVNPLGKIPAILDDGRPLFESAAICVWLADKHADKQLIPPAGSWARALHDQWTCFILSEVEAHLWSDARNTFVYPEADRLPAVRAQNARELARALPVLDRHLEATPYLVDGRFTVTDVIAGFALNWARRTIGLEGCPALAAYVQRLLARPLCPYAKDDRLSVDAG